MFWKKRTHLDIAAGVSGNPSSPHEEGRQAKRILEDARTTIARLVEVQADDVIFTSGATESNALAILGHVRALRALAGPDTAGRNNLHVLYLPSAHASIVENAKLLAEEGVAVEPLPIIDARVDTKALAKMVREETVLVAMDAVCGETGVVWNTREVAQVLRGHPMSQGHRMSALLHVDASQAPLSEKFSRAHFDAGMLTFDASKVSGIRGIRGIGALIAHRTIPLMPLYRGGPQERGLRPGSEAPELAQKFAAALGAAALDRERFRTVAKRERARLVALVTAVIPDARVHEGRAQAPHILNFSLPGYNTDYLVALLDEAGFAVGARSACETDSEEGSRAVYELTGDRAQALTTLRISWNSSVEPRELTRFSLALERALPLLAASSPGR